jgi:hypothetical protein
MVKTANPKPHGVRGPYSRPGAKQANIDICNDYHQRQDYYDAQAAAAPGNSKKSGLLFAYRKAAHGKTEHKLTPFRTVERWWANGKWRQKGAATEKGGAPKYLTREQEDVMVHFCLQAAVAGFAIRVSEIKMRARMIAKVNGTLSRIIGTAGGAGGKRQATMDGWFLGFLKRANRIAEVDGHGADAVSTIAKRHRGGRLAKVLQVKKKGQGLSVSRLKNLRPVPIKIWAEDVINPFLAAHPSMTIANIANFDEWQLNTHDCLLKGKVCGPPGHMYTVLPSERDEHMTVLSGIIGSWAMPCLIIFKGEKSDLAWQSTWLDEYVAKRPELKGYVMVATSPNGWITPELKFQFVRHVIEHPDFPDESHLWPVDGHVTNHELGLLEYMLNSEESRKAAIAAEAAAAGAAPDPEDDAAVTAADEAGPSALDEISSAVAPRATAAALVRAADRLEESKRAESFAASVRKALASAKHKRQQLAILPSHCTHGLQHLDNLIIALTKLNLGHIFEQLVNSDDNVGAKLTKEDIVTSVGLAIYGGEINGPDGEPILIKGGHCAETCLSAHRRVGYTFDADGGNLGYDPIAALPSWKFLPGIVVEGAGDVGPTQRFQPLAEHSDAALNKRRPTLKGSHSPAGEPSEAAKLAAEALAKRIPRPFGKGKQDRKTRDNASGYKVPSGCLRSEGDLEIARAAQKAAKQKKADDTSQKSAAASVALEESAKTAARVVIDGTYDLDRCGIKELKAILRAHNQHAGTSKYTKKPQLRSAVEARVEELEPTALVMQYEAELEEVDEMDDDDSDDA